MKLLLDQNLSPRLVPLLADLFADSNHVEPLGLSLVLDLKVWNYAKENGFVVVSKDADFSELSLLLDTRRNLSGCVLATAQQRRSSGCCAPISRLSRR